MSDELTQRILTALTELGEAVATLSRITTSIVDLLTRDNQETILACPCICHEGNSGIKCECFYRSPVECYAYTQEDTDA